ncbi:putative type-1 restriction enzyme [Candidatus Accumulibacter aalborgensis]|uniref:Putative type-1 restriction enzyme n=1 Tax=Candidatus Accumulibacter aalborgensis TaxID=1860102 RepID=A0A1A8XQ52_9PROT|nr:putative type-1 restriction enzyme [Candidatus Accumulibacter aalborgensis]
MIRSNKQTELGAIPQAWTAERISDAAGNSANAIVGGPFGSDLVSADYVASGIPVIRGQNMAASVVSGEFVFVSPQKAKSLSANLAYPGDLVFTQRGTLGQVAIVPDDRHECYLVSQSQMKVTLNRTRHDPWFVHQYFASCSGQKQIALSAIQTGVPHTNLGILRAYRFPAPPLVEQHAIAAALSDVDALLGGLERLIAKKRDLKQAAMQQLLTGQTRLPGFSGEWEVKRLGDVATLNRLNVVPASQPDQPFVHFSLPAYDDGKSAQVELGSAIGSNKFGIPPSAVLVSKLNPRIPRIWAPEVIPKNACASTEWLILTPREGTDRAFLFVLCSSPGFCQQMELAATGTTGSHQRISPNTALHICVAVPVEREEQTAIATVLSDMDAELSALEARRDKTRALKQAMMQELLTGRVRLISGELKVESGE